MERLTKRNENGLAVLNVKCPEGCEHSTCSMEEGYQCQHQCEGDIIKKLAEYEDLEEQGLLLKLPCKVGDKVYYVISTMKNPIDFQIVKIEIFQDEIIYVDDGDNEWRVEDFGKLVFLTQAEAEQKLKEMESD